MQAIKFILALSFLTSATHAAVELPRHCFTIFSDSSISLIGSAEYFTPENAPAVERIIEGTKKMISRAGTGGLVGISYTHALPWLQRLLTQAYEVKAAGYPQTQMTDLADRYSLLVTLPYVIRTLSQTGYAQYIAAGTLPSEPGSPLSVRAFQSDLTRLNLTEVQFFDQIFSNFDRFYMREMSQSRASLYQNPLRRRRIYTFKKLDALHFIELLGTGRAYIGLSDRMFSKSDGYVGFGFRLPIHDHIHDDAQTASLYYDFKLNDEPPKLLATRENADAELRVLRDKVLAIEDFQLKWGTALVLFYLTHEQGTRVCKTVGEVRFALTSPYGTHFDELIFHLRLEQYSDAMPSQIFRLPNAEFEDLIRKAIAWIIANTG